MFEMMNEWFWFCSGMHLEVCVSWFCRGTFVVVVFDFILGSDFRDNLGVFADIKSEPWHKIKIFIIFKRLNNNTKNDEINPVLYKIGFKVEQFQISWLACLWLVPVADSYLQARHCFFLCYARQESNGTNILKQRCINQCFWLCQGLARRIGWWVWRTPRRRLDITAKIFV